MFAQLPTLRARSGAIVARKTWPAYTPGGVVSFTFDDFPRSAWRVGGAILEQHGVRGTYYAGMACLGASNEHGDYFTAEDLSDLTARGHEIGCHTHSHLDCSRATADEAVADVERNARALAGILPDYRLVSFSYPLGRTRPGTKRRLARRFATCRGAADGLNEKRSDLALLRANSLYSASDDLGARLATIAENAGRGGWLLFYTHDVAERPSPIGCTPADLAALVQAALAAGSRILPVRNALAAASFGEHA